MFSQSLKNYTVLPRLPANIDYLRNYLRNCPLFQLPPQTVLSQILEAQDCTMYNVQCTYVVPMLFTIVISPGHRCVRGNNTDNITESQITCHTIVQLILKIHFKLISPRQVNLKHNMFFNRIFNFLNILVVSLMSQRQWLWH